MVEREERKAHLLAGEIAAILHETSLKVEQSAPREFRVWSTNPHQYATRLRLKFTREGWKYQQVTWTKRSGENNVVRLAKPIIQGRGPRTHKDAEIHLIPKKNHIIVKLGVLGWFKRRDPGPLVSAQIAKLVAGELAKRSQ